MRRRLPAKCRKPAERNVDFFIDEYNWPAYSWGGCALVYDADIARALCAPWELRRTRGGELRPNRREEWLDVQARALAQACRRIERIVGARG